MPKYHYKIECVGGLFTTFDGDRVLEFETTAPAIVINNDAQRMQTIIMMRNVVRIERTENNQ